MATNQTGRLRVGLIGCGSIAQQMHLPYLKELDDRFEVKALCDLSARTVRALADRHQVDRAFTDYRKLVEEDLDAVMVLTSGARAEIVEAAAASGKHVFVEKPMAYSLEEADAMLEACSRNGVVLMVGYMKRYDPGFLRGRALMQRLSGVSLIRSHDVIGPNRAFIDDVAHIVRHGDIDPELLAASKRGVEARVQEAIGLSEGPVHRAFHVMLGLSVHDMAVLRGVFGSPEAVLSTHVWNEGRNFVSVLDYGPGVRCVFEAGHMEIKKFDEELTAYGDDGVVSVKFPSPFIKNAPTLVQVWTMEGDDYVEKEILASYEESFKRELIHFHESVTKGSTPETPGADAREDLAVLIAMAKAAKLNRPVPITPVSKG